MYIFKNTELNNKKSADYETKSLLYLFGMRKDSEKVDIVVIDCFNDVTGVNESFDLMLDVQSKNYTKFTPSLIGSSLYTLYDNHISDFTFNDYVLFSKPLDASYLIDSKADCFGYDNIVPKTKTRIEKKLREVIVKNHGCIDESMLDSFLRSITFFGDKKSCSDYIKKVTKFRAKKIISDTTYENIFNEIRDVQSSLKNSEIENVSISSPSEVLNLNRYLTKDKLHSLIISRLIGVSNIFKENSLPTRFFEVIHKEGLSTSFDDMNDVIIDCNSRLSRTFFDKGTSKSFWNLVEKIIKGIKKFETLDVYHLYSYIEEEVKKIPPHLDKLSILFLISLIVQGINNDI
ncbi:hypothetical protein KCU34_001713 [Vibrio vulnificus]|nr:hypothetical protein [Vibrio vulnificus]